MSTWPLVLLVLVLTYYWTSKIFAAYIAILEEKVSPEFNIISVEQITVGYLFTSWDHMSVTKYFF